MQKYAGRKTNGMLQNSLRTQNADCTDNRVITAIEKGKGNVGKGNVRHAPQKGLAK